MIAIMAVGKPMTSSVNSWEGDFTLEGTNIPIRIRDMPTIFLWKYELHSGNGGIAIGFSNENRDMILAPKPYDKGVQPICTGYFISINDDHTADIYVTYSIQGNGGWKAVEKYVYDGKTISLHSTTLNGGKPDFEWFSLAPAATEAGFVGTWTNSTRTSEMADTNAFKWVSLTFRTNHTVSWQWELSGKIEDHDGMYHLMTAEQSRESRMQSTNNVIITPDRNDVTASVLADTIIGFGIDARISTKQCVLKFTDAFGNRLMFIRKEYR